MQVKAGSKAELVCTDKDGKETRELIYDSATRTVLFKVFITEMNLLPALQKHVSTMLLI